MIMRRMFWHFKPKFKLVPKFTLIILNLELSIKEIICVTNKDLTIRMMASNQNTFHKAFGIKQVNFQTSMILQWFMTALPYRATPIYLLVLRAQEVGNEPFWNKKKSWKMWLFLFILFFLESDD